MFFCLKKLTKLNKKVYNMARPERNTVDYFPFYCDEGKKMFYIEETYGNDGFAVFVKLLRELAKTEFHYLNLSEKTTQMFLAAKCKVSKEVLIFIINDLVELGKFDAYLWNENKIIWCQDFIDSIQDAYKKRNNECITLEGLHILLTSLGITKQSKSNSEGSVNPQIKLKKTKVNKTKVNNDDFLIFWDLYDKKIDQKKCIEKWSKLNESEKKKIFETLPAYIKSKPDKQYRKNPLTYLNGRCWEDEIEIINLNNKPQSYTAEQLRDLEGYNKTRRQMKLAEKTMEEYLSTKQ